MATYFEDAEVGELIERYAKQEGKTKTGALRDLLRRELSVRPGKTPEQRLKSIVSFVNSEATEKAPIRKSDVDALYGYLDVD